MTRLLKDHDFKFTTCKGVYKGVSEDSFIVLLDSYNQLEVLQDLSRVYNQECILYSDSNRMSYLKYPCGKSEKLGVLKQVSKEVAMMQDAYTIVNNNYYLVG